MNEHEEQSEINKLREENRVLRQLLDEMERDIEQAVDALRNDIHSRKVSTALSILEDLV